MTSWLVSRGTHVVLIDHDDQQAAHEIGALRLTGWSPQQITKCRRIAAYEPLGDRDTAIIWRRKAIADALDGATIRRATPADIRQVQLVLDQQAAGRDGARR